MQCSKCKKAATIYLPALQPLCDVCFCVQIEKRIRKYTRINRMFSKGDNIITVGELCEYLVKNIIESLPVSIKRADAIPKAAPKNVKVVVPDTMDDIECRFLKEMFENRPVKKDSYIRIISVLTDKEAQAFARIKGINFDLQKKDGSSLHFLDELEKKHAETRFSLLKSIEDIRKQV